MLRTKGGFDWSERYPRIVRSVLNLSVESISHRWTGSPYLPRTGLSDFLMRCTVAPMMRGRSSWHSTFWEIEGEDLATNLHERKRRLRQAS